MEEQLEKTNESSEEKIQLTLLNGRGFVFEVKDYMLLRRKHRIIGAFVGTAAARGWAANDCALPIELTSWETRLLLEKGIAELVSKKEQLLKKDTEEELNTYKEHFELRLSHQEESLKDEKLKESERNIDKILAGKRKKLLKQGVPDEEINLSPQDVLQEIRRGITFERKNALLDIPCAHPDAHAAFKVSLSQLDSSLKYQVFCDLWSRGKYVTCGDAFGADFLIYPGDPLQYHASHVLILLENAKVMALDLVANVRLSVMVNKLCVFAYFATEEDAASPLPRKIAYDIVTWEGDKDKERRKM